MPFEPMEPYKRRSIRFSPDMPTLAYLRPELEGQMGQGEVPGIVRDESYRGCCVLLKGETPVEMGIEGVIKVGALAPLKFRVAWIQRIQRGYKKVGIEYLE